MPNGIIILDKPQGWTSMDVCAKLRGILGERRIGHAGTLDPMATGILPVFVGRATRAVEFAAGADKEYVAGLRLGLVTNTQDTTGEVLEQRPVSAGRAELEAALARFRGEISQIPPMYSAIKIGGKKLYELARKGREVERPPRQVTIHTLEVLEQAGPVDYLLRVVCSKGTYVRTLCHDLGACLGCGGTMYSLRRTRVGAYSAGHSLEEIQAAADAGGLDALLLGVDTCFAQFPPLSVGETAWQRFIRNGAPCPSDAPPGTYRVYGPEGAFLMLGRAEGGQLYTVKNFFPVP